uniref:Ninjurin n=1 Tax=Timema monikensis TaxID=170555 RepID=A0A7R9HSJ7_9NEOP|nr:unnamed protein product [Timema monikensis]
MVLSGVNSRSRAPLAAIETDMNLPLEPLREHDLDDKPAPRPTSGPEIDDLDPTTSDAGIDDGLLPDQPRRRGPSNGGGEGEWPTINIPETPTLDIPRRGVDLNVYQHKKTLAQGMMDLALLSANANQLRYVLESDGRHPYYYPGLVLISMSIFLQVYSRKEAMAGTSSKLNDLDILDYLDTIDSDFVDESDSDITSDDDNVPDLRNPAVHNMSDSDENGMDDEDYREIPSPEQLLPPPKSYVTVGVGLILNSRYNVKRERDIWKADRINNLTVLGIFLVTVTNIFISAFGVAASPSEVEPLKLTEEGVTTELFDELVL